MESEKQSSHEGMETPKWTWSPLYGPIHKGNLCPDCNAWVEHVSEHAFNGVPSLSIAQQYMQQVARHKYNHRWDNCDKAQMEGHRLQIGCVCSTLQMLATCIVRTTRAIWWASKNAIDHIHLMNRCRFSPELWEGAVRELINIDSTLLPSLPRSEIVMYDDDIVVSTPHRLLTINYNNPAEHLNVQMATIQVKGESEKPNGSWTFRYAMHMKNTANKAVEGTHPQIALEMCRCTTIETKVNGCKVYIMIDTGSTGNFMSPAFAKVTRMKVFPLEQQFTLQLGCIGSQSKITHGGKTHIKLGSRTSEIYFDVANIDWHNCILGIPFLQEQQAVLNFANQKIQIGDNTIALLEEVIPDICLRNPVQLPQNPK